MTCKGSLVAAAAVACGLALYSGGAFGQQSWNMATTWGGGPLFENAAKRAADNIELLTNGAIRLQVLPGGALGNPLEVTEAVGNRAVESGHTWAGYEWADDKTTVLLGNFAGGLDGPQMIHWLYQGGGAALYREYRLEVFNVVSIPCGILPREMGMHSRKRVETLEDFKGLKLRTAGPWAEIAAELGAVTVSVPGPEVYAALERGTIDAVEWAQVSFNRSLGFHKLARYLIVPGIQQPSTVLECTINKDVWDGLSERDRQLIEIAGRLTSLDLYRQTGHDDAEAYRQILQSGNEIVVLDAEVQRRAQELSLAWAERISAEKGGWFTKIWEHQRAYRQVWEDARRYRDAAPPLN